MSPVVTSHLSTGGETRGACPELAATADQPVVRRRPLPVSQPPRGSVSCRTLGFHGQRLNTSIFRIRLDFAFLRALFASSIRLWTLSRSSLTKEVCVGIHFLLRPRAIRNQNPSLPNKCRYVSRSLAHLKDNLCCRKTPFAAVLDARALSLHQACSLAQSAPLCQAFPGLRNPGVIGQTQPQGAAVGDCCNEGTHGRRGREGQGPQKHQARSRWELPGEGRAPRAERGASEMSLHLGFALREGPLEG